MGKIKLSSKSSDLNYPAIKPTLNLNFAATKTLDPRITFTRNSIGTYVGSDGYIKTAVANQPRFDHDPITGKCLGLLVEEQRTNSITQSEAFDTWQFFSTSITSNIVGIVSPDGTSGKVDLWNGSGFIRSFSSSSTNRIISVYVKYTGNTGSFRIGSFGGNTIYTTFTISSTGVITANTPSVGTSISVGNGWYRVYMNIGTGNEHIIELVSGTPSLYLWGAQSEAGTFPTSYIPTSGSTVTRLADSATITGTNFSSWYNSSGGTLLSIDKENSHKITSSSLTLSTDPSEKSTASNVLYYPTVIQYATLKTMNAYPSVVTDGLVLHLDASKQKSYPGSGTIWTDLSGNGNNGTLVNGPTYSSANGGSLVFDGTDDHVTLGTFFNYQNFTISLWVKPGSTQVTYADIFDNNHTSFQNFVLQQFENNINQYSFGVNDATGIISSSSIITLIANTWTNIAFTFSPSSRVVSYVNGSFYSQGHFANNRNILYLNQSFSIARWSNGGRNWNGLISNFIAYNRVLSQTEIQQNFNALRGRFGL